VVIAVEVDVDIARVSELLLFVEIREVSSEMPMYLLAEDEGNEEEILRLLESNPSSSLTSPTSEAVLLSSSLREKREDWGRNRALISGVEDCQSNLSSQSGIGAMFLLPSLHTVKQLNSLWSLFITFVRSDTALFLTKKKQLLDCHHL